MRISWKKCSCNLQSELWRVRYYCLLNRKRPVIKTATFVPNLQNESMDRKVWIPFYGLLLIEKWSHIGTLIRHRKRGRKQQQQPSQLVKHIYHIQMMYYMVYVLHTHLLYVFVVTQRHNLSKFEKFTQILCRVKTKSWNQHKLSLFSGKFYFSVLI